MTLALTTAPVCSCCGKGTRHDHNPAPGRTLCHRCASSEREQALSLQAATAAEIAEQARRVVCAEEESARQILRRLFPHAALPAAAPAVPSTILEARDGG